MPDGSTAIIANFTVVSPGGGGYVSAAPAGTTTSTSLINMQPGTTISNLGVVKVNSAEDVVLQPVWAAGTPSGTTARVLVDLLGYVKSESQGNRELTYNATPPQRRYDDSIGAGTITVDASIEIGQTDPPASLVLPTADAILLNVTGQNPPSNGYCTAFQSGTVPGTSTLNFTTGVSVNANHAIAAGSYVATQSYIDQHARVSLYCSLGTMRRIVDTVGYLD